MLLIRFLTKCIPSPARSVKSEPCQSQESKCKMLQRAVLHVFVHFHCFLLDFNNENIVFKLFVFHFDAVY